jgi:hypothetical protein
MVFYIISCFFIFSFGFQYIFLLPTYTRSGGAFVNNGKKDNIIMLNGGKTDASEDIAELKADDKVFKLKSFIISGETPEGKRLVFTWNASLDTILSYNYVMNIAVEDKVRDAFYPSPSQ